MRLKGVHRNLGDPEHFFVKTEIGEDNSPQSGKDGAEGVPEVGSVHNRGNVARNRRETAEGAALEGTDRDKKWERETMSIRRGGAATERKLKHIAKVSRENPHYRFTSLASLLNEEFLVDCYLELERHKASGVDGVSVEEYAENLHENLQGLVTRMKAKQYLPQPVLRIYIPKDNGGRRPLGIPAIEDKIVQMGITKILESVFGAEFLDVSHGFRRGKSCHSALDTLDKAIMTKPTNHIVDADIRGFFDNVDHKWMVKFLEQKIGDLNLIRLIVRFLKSGIMEEGKYFDTEAGTPQGGILSPMLSNIYLHYVLDLWIEKKMKKECGGYIEEVRYADDFVICVQHKADGELTMRELRERLAKFGLTLSEEKTRLIEFGRFAKVNAERRGEKPATFDFLGFTHYSDKTRRGYFKVGRKTSKKKYRLKMKAMNKWLMENMHTLKTAETWQILRAKLIGHYRYYGVSGNYASIGTFRHKTVGMVFKALNRRSQKRSVTWEQFHRYLVRYPLPKPKIYHNLYTSWTPTPTL